MKRFDNKILVFGIIAVLLIGGLTFVSSGDNVTGAFSFSKFRNLFNKEQRINFQKPVVNEEIVNNEPDLVLNSPYGPQCYDSDGGRNIFEKGQSYMYQNGEVYTVWNGQRQEGQSINDVCINGQVKENYCENNQLVSEVINCPEGYECPAQGVGFCVPEGLYDNICGNGVCEDGERENGCIIDCKTTCLNYDYCNDKVGIYCGCDSWNYFSTSTPCMRAKGSCEDCSELEPLFDDLLVLQTEAFDCLADYFDYDSLSVRYYVFYDGLADICNNPEGCFYSQFADLATNVGLLSRNNLGSVRAFGENNPVVPENLRIDLHETTHFFLFNMLHHIPKWFHEAVAIQTQERLVDCHPQVQPEGDFYMVETEVDLEAAERRGHLGGINMDDGTNFNVDFYRRLKAGETAFSEDEEGSYYFKGVLYIIGLKEDYGCGRECVAEIVKTLRGYREEMCEISQYECGVIPAVKVAAEWPTSGNACEFEQSEDNNLLTGEVSFPLKKSINFRDSTNLKQIKNLDPNWEIHKDKNWMSWVTYNGRELATEDIHRATEEVVGEDVSDLFELLDLYNIA